MSTWNNRQIYIFLAFCVAIEIMLATLLIWLSP